METTPSFPSGVLPHYPGNTWKKRPHSLFILLKGAPLTLKFYLSFILGALA